MRFDLMFSYSARRATYVGTEPTDKRGLVNSSGGKGYNGLPGIFFSSRKTIAI